MMKQYLVLKISGGGGLGDSIKCLLVALLYAHKSKRVLVIDWVDSIYKKEHENIFQLVLDIKNILYQTVLPTSEDVYPDSWKGRLDYSLDKIYQEDGWVTWDRSKVIERYSFDLGKLNYSEEVLVMWEFDQINKLLPFYEAPANVAELYRHAWKKFCQPSSEVKKRVAELTLNKKMSNLGVHVRATKEFFDNKGVINVNDFVVATKKAQKRWGVNTVFLATDNQEVEALFENNSVDIYVVPKWFAQPGEALHITEECPDKHEALKCAMVDIMLLASCKYLIVNSVSSFSEVAIIISSIESRKIIQIDKSVSLLNRMKKRWLKS